jgi:hypothetical protein
LIGIDEIVSNIDYASLNPTVDVGELGAGSHTVAIQVNLPDGIEIIGELVTTLIVTEK